jgi:hemoglobin-like flavoprotein
MDLDLHALETSFDLSAPHREELMDDVYARLFEAAPTVRPLFDATDMRRQKAMLVGVLMLLRKSLRDLGTIVPTLRKLGARHVVYGAQAEHYPIVRDALIGAMAAIAGPVWSCTYESAWRKRSRSSPLRCSRAPAHRCSTLPRRPPGGLEAARRASLPPG